MAAPCWRIVHPALLDTAVLTSRVLKGLVEFLVKRVFSSGFEQKRPILIGKFKGNGILGIFEEF